MKGESFFALCAGLMTGAVIGILFAPEKGEVTRKKIKDVASDKYDDLIDATSTMAKKTQEKVGQLQKDVVKAKDSLMKYGAELKEDAREKILQQLNNLEEAIAKVEEKTK